MMNVDFNDKRLDARYEKCVQGHLKHAQTVASGASVPRKLQQPFAATQALWRLLGNEKVSTQKLAAPLHALAKNELMELCEKVTDSLPIVPVAHDWSHIGYKNHTSKKDKFVRENGTGYDLFVSLLLHPETGEPIVPLHAHLIGESACYTTGETAIPASTSHLEQVLPRIGDIEKLNLPVRLIHIIDREADSVYHMRQWAESGKLFLVRGDGDRIVKWEDRECLLEEVASQLMSLQRFTKLPETVLVKNVECEREVCETRIILERPAKRNVKDKRTTVTGVPLALRLVLCRIVSKEDGSEQGMWYLLTNADVSVSTVKIADMYHWRWKIESFYKLLKSGGLELEHWEQETGERIFKRLLIAVMAISLVWRLSRDKNEESLLFQKTLARLSGKTHRYGVSPTTGILLSGLYVLLRMNEFLESIGDDPAQISALRAAAKQFLQGSQNV